MAISEQKRITIWQARVDADYRHRYFLKVKDKLQSRILLISVLIGVSSSFPLLMILFNIKTPPSVDIIFALCASLLGVYLASSGLVRGLATAINAASTWDRASSRYQVLWDETEEGKDDVYEKHIELDNALQFTSVEVTNNLPIYDDLCTIAEKESHTALAI